MFDAHAFVARCHLAPPPMSFEDEEKTVQVHVDDARRTGFEEPIEATTVQEPEPLQPHDDVPDGGLVAWLQVFGSYFAFMDTWYDPALRTTHSTCVY